tara:strand:- start:840 stop:1085 length:246 start_codon:yes stop_codon:yes gene_type:complete
VGAGAGVVGGERDVPPTNRLGTSHSALNHLPQGHRWIPLQLGGAGFHASIRSVLNTGRCQGMSAFQSIQAVIVEEPLIQTG